MITSPAFAGKRYAVLGLARSGLASAEALLASGAHIVAWDSSERARENLRSSRAKSRGAGTDSEVRPSTSLGTNELRIEDILETDITGFDGIVVSPGVPINRHPIADRAREAGVALIGDIELFAQARLGLPPHKVVGITGTNGKSTTTALICHILRSAGVPATMAGNIGFPIMEQDPLPAGGVYVLELSSYQIDLTRSLDCDIAVLLNITPDHLDRYGGFDGYVASKARLLAMQSPEHVAVIAIEDELTRAIAAQPGARRILVSSSDVGDQSRWPSLQGPHNAQNAAAAIAATRELGLSDAQIDAGLRSYVALPHRMEPIGEKHGVLFVNDSKATNPDSTAPALAAFPAIHWIVGGLAKSEELGPIEAQLGHVRAAYTIGEAGPMFARLLEGKVPVRPCELLIDAVGQAAEAARPGEVVLLSPACASFDQFRDFEARGDTFRAAVEALA